MSSELTERVRETIRSAAQKLTGYSRRQFQAECAEQYCEGNPRRAELVFGWGRDAVRLGLHERRTGIRCVDDYSTRGRRKTEEKIPELTAEIEALVEPASQADPKFQTPLAYTRMTAKAVHEQLAAKAAQLSGPVPAERTLHDILNRLGYRLRRVRKTKPQKNSRDRRDLRASSAGACAGRHGSADAADLVGHESQGQDRRVFAPRRSPRTAGGRRRRS